jgi:hypothetical protein
MASVFFVVRVPRNARPTQNREYQAEPGCCETQNNADPDCEGHSEKHPKKASSVMTFVDMSEAWYDAEQRCDFILGMLTTNSCGECLHVDYSSLRLTVYHSGCLKQPTMISA